MTDQLSHRATYNEHELHLGAVEDCNTCNGLAFPKPVPINDPELRKRFRETRDRCQACCGSTLLQTHHMEDQPNLPKRADVFANLMRLCRDCHLVEFHHKHRWTKAQLRRLKDGDEQQRRHEYADLEDAYDGRVLWAVAA